MSTPRKLEVPRIPYAASALKGQEIPKVVLKQLLLKLYAAHTNAVGGATMTVETFMKLVQSIKLTKGGNDNLVQIPLWVLYYMNLYDYSKAPINVISTAAGAQTSYVSLILPFALTRSVSPEDTLLDLRNEKSVVLDVQWGTAIGTAGVTSIDSAYLKIISDELQDEAAQDRARHELSFYSTTLPITGDNPVQIPTRGLSTQYKRFILFTRDGTGALANTVANSFELKARGFTFAKMDAQDIQDFNALDYTVTPAPGVYVIDPTRFGKMTQRIDATNMPELILNVNTPAGTGSLDILAEKAVYAIPQK